MIAAADILRERERRKGRSLLVGQKWLRLSWLVLAGALNERVEKGAMEVTCSIFSLRPLFRRLDEFHRG